jgi:hypothetical protein
VFSGRPSNFNGNAGPYNFKETSIPAGYGCVVRIKWNRGSIAARAELSFVVFRHNEIGLGIDN